MTSVRPAVTADVDELARVLARAFFDDPVAVHLLPSARRRPAGLRAFFGVQLRRQILPLGGGFTTDDLAGAALWTPPGSPPTRLLAALAALVPVAPYVAGRHLGRTLRGLGTIGAIHPTEPHWYLAALGTDPDRQGRGVGSALLGPVLTRCDEDGLRAYLESSKARNVPFYRRHGFEVTGEVRLPGGPVVWTMWRDPRPPD
ncbi:MAG: GNAT family N-acetyltransferase [Acidimicrobiales bacterium]